MPTSGRSRFLSASLKRRYGDACRSYNPNTGILSVGSGENLRVGLTLLHASLEESRCDTSLSTVTREEQPGRCLFIHRSRASLTGSTLTRQRPCCRRLPTTSSVWCRTASWSHAGAAGERSLSGRPRSRASRRHCRSPPDEEDLARGLPERTHQGRCLGLNQIKDE
jgi:hypothetical protein